MPGNANILIIEGRLTKDPSLQKTPKGTSICKFSMANNRYYYTEKGFKNEVSYFDVVVWGKSADKGALHLRKGRHILISGEIRQDIYTSKSGERKQKIYIIASEIKYLDKKNTAEEKNTNAHYLNDIINDIGKNTIEETLAVNF